MVKAYSLRTLIFHKDKCISCAGCVGICPQLALDMFETNLQVFEEKCAYCYLCVRFCPVGAFNIEEKKI